MKDIKALLLISLLIAFVLLAFGVSAQQVSTEVTNFGYTADNIVSSCNCSKEVVTTYHLEDWYIEGASKIFEYAIIKNGVVQHARIEVVVTYKSVTARVNADIDYYATGALYYVGNVSVNSYYINGRYRTKITEYLPYIPQVLKLCNITIR